LVKFDTQTTSEQQIIGHSVSPDRHVQVHLLIQLSLLNMHSAYATAGDYHTPNKHADGSAETLCAEPTGSANPQPKRAHHAEVSIAAVCHEQSHECCKVIGALEAVKAATEHKHITLARCGCQQQQQQVVHEKQPMEEEEELTEEKRAQLITVQNLHYISYVDSQLPLLERKVRMAECMRRGQEIMLAEQLAKLKSLQEQIAEAKAKLAAAKAARAAAATASQPAE